MKRDTTRLWLYLLSPVFVFIVVLFSPVILFLIVKDWWERRKFYKKVPRNLFFVCTTRHQWEPFLRNNVLPTLPEHIQIYWIPDRQHKKKSLIDRLYPPGHSKPFLIHYHKRGYEMVPLHDELLDLKEHAQASPEIQSIVQGKLQTAIEQIQKKIDGKKTGSSKR